MNAKRSFAPVPDFVAKMAADAPGATPENAPAQAPQPAAPAFKLPVKASTKSMSVNMPKEVYDELRDYWKLTDVPMTDVIVAGTIAELARRKKHHG